MSVCTTYDQVVTCRPLADVVGYDYEGFDHVSTCSIRVWRGGDMVTCSHGMILMIWTTCRPVVLVDYIRYGEVVPC